MGYALKGSDPTKFLFWLEGGGSCADVASCQARCAKGSGLASKCTARTRATIPAEAILSDNPKSPFASFTKVHVPYCTSDTHAGNRAASADTGGFAFRGAEVIAATVDYLKAHMGLDDALQVMLTGSSGGGAGVNANCDRLARWLPGASVKCVSDATWKNHSFPPYAEPCPQETANLSAAVAFWNASDATNRACAAAVSAAGGDPLSCKIASTLWKHIEQPYFVASSQYDAHALHDDCVDWTDQQGTEAYFAKYGAAAQLLNAELVAAKQASPDKYRHLGMFSPSCYKHEMLPVVEYLAEVKVPVVAGAGVGQEKSYAELLTAWFFGNGTEAASAGADTFGAGQCGGLPCNSACANPENTCPYVMSACKGG